MSEILEKIEKYKRNELRALLEQCEKGQQEKFNRLFPKGIDQMDDTQFRVAILLVERTVKANILKATEK